MPENKSGLSSVAANKLKYIDALRVILIVLVVAHHSAKAYIIHSSHELQLPDPMVNSATGFLWLNISFLMAVFFFISAYFMPGALSKRGFLNYMKDRLWRLDLPLVLGAVLFIPLETWFRYQVSGLPQLDFWTYFVDHFLGMGDKPVFWPVDRRWPELQLGRFWFLEHLSIYSLLFVFLAVSISPLSYRAKLAPKPNLDSAPSDMVIVIFTLIVSVSIYFARQYYPSGEWIGFLGFIQSEPGRVPQYILFFMVGLYAGKQRWIESMPAFRGIAWFSVGMILAITMLASAYLPTINRNSLIACIFESFLTIGLCIGLPVFLREIVKIESSVWTVLNNNVFAVYVFHYPFVLLFQYSLIGGIESNVIRMILTIIATVLISFLFTHFLVLRTPILRRIF